MSTIFSDGGSDSKGHAGAACIVIGSDKIRSFGFYLGKATNNEGEIFASLAGFAFCLFEDKKNLSKIKWVSDSEYALKSASQYILNWEKNGWKTSQKEPVKNQGLWKTFLNLTRDIKFETQHVKGHSGHPENESCDEAVGWVRGNSEYFCGNWIKEVVDLSNEDFSPWYMRDASHILEEIRESGESGIKYQRFLDLLDFSKIDFSKEPTRMVKEIVDSSKDSLTEAKKVTKSYLKKLQTIDPSGDLMKSEKEFHQAVKILKGWVK